MMQNAKYFENQAQVEDNPDQSERLSVYTKKLVIFHPTLVISETILHLTLLIIPLGSVIYLPILISLKMQAINFKMWGKALKTIPKVSKEEWNSLDIVSKWLISTRSAVFVMTAISCIIGGLLALKSGEIVWANFMVAFIGLIFAHASNNLINDFTDTRLGIDKNDYFRSQYGTQALEHELFSKNTFYRYIGFSLLVGVLCGAFLVWQTGIVTLYLFLSGLFFLFFYTWPLKYIGMGEPTVVLVWGPLMVGGTYFVSTGGTWSWSIALIGLAYALGPTAVLFGKHIDKSKEDIVKGVRTLPVLLGEKLSRWVTISMWSVQYLFLAWLVYNHVLGFPVLITLFALPKFLWAAKAYSKPRPTERPEGEMKNAWPLYLVHYAFLYNKRFGILFLLGLVLDLLIKF